MSLSDISTSDLKVCFRFNLWMGPNPHFLIYLHDFLWVNWIQFFLEPRSTFSRCFAMNSAMIWWFFIIWYEYILLLFISTVSITPPLSWYQCICKLCRNELSVYCWSLISTLNISMELITEPCYFLPHLSSIIYTISISTPQQYSFIMEIINRGK